MWHCRPLPDTTSINRGCDPKGGRAVDSLYFFEPHAAARCGRKLGLLGGSSCIRTKSACAQSGSRSEAAFVEAIETVAGDAVSITWRYADKQGTPPNWAQLLEGHGIGSHYCCCPSVKFSTIFCGLQCWLECCAPSVFDFGRCHPSSAASGCRVDPKGLFSTLFGQNTWYMHTHRAPEPRREDRVASTRYSVEYGRENDGRYWAAVPALPGVLVHGENEDEVKAKVSALALRALAERLESHETKAHRFSFHVGAWFVAQRLESDLRRNT